jgi:acyl carrier protein
MTPTAPELSAWIRQWLAQKLAMPLSSIEEEDPLSAYGVDSMMVMEFEAEISEHLGFEWPVRELLIRDPAIRELAAKGAALAREARP